MNFLLTRALPAAHRAINSRNAEPDADTVVLCTGDKAGIKITLRIEEEERVSFFACGVLFIDRGS